MLEPPYIKVYLSSSMKRAMAMEYYKERMHTIFSIEVVSTWMDNKKETISPSEIAVKDRAELDKADIFIFEVDWESTTGGKWWELGYADASEKLIWMVGHPDNNPFTHLPDYRYFNSFAEVFDELKKLAQAYSLPYVEERLMELE